MRLSLVALTFLFPCLFSGGIHLYGETPIDWTRYHNFSETTEIMKTLAEEYKDLSKLYSIGKSFQGKDIWCMEITNYATGAPETKPGAYIDGNTHAGEVSGAETCLYTINHLLTRYGKDPSVTRMLDTRVFYILPKINPDGSDSYLRKPGEPIDPDLIKVDDDEDGKSDEDGSEDLNQDGIRSVMRIRDERGPLRTSPDDPRLMVKRGIDEKGEWRIIGPEGIDDDNDGKINEDPPGRVRTVSNRNYPAYWAPEWRQSNAGPYPLSEPEAKAQIDFILAHSNIAGLQVFHTHSGIILYPYCALSEDNIPAEDMGYIKAIGELGTKITGYPLVSIYNDFTPDKSKARRGSILDWAYDHFGAFSYSTEIWKAPGETGKSAFEGQDELIAMKWNDEELGGKGFVNWEKVDHPQFGEVEIGGWDYNYFTQNPPPKFAEAEWEKNCLFEIKRAELLPNLTIVEAKVDSLGDELFRITTTVENEGYLPSYVVRKAIENGIAKPVEATIELENAELFGGETDTEIGHLKGNGPEVSSWARGRPTPVPQNRKTVSWLVRTTGKGASATITFSSQKAGTKSRKIDLRTP